MLNFDDTIVAISTPPGVGAIGVVRLSGKEAFAIAQKIFRKRDSDGAVQLTAHHAAYGHVIDPRSQQVVDEIVLTPFKGPHTYTGEDLVEISCHGGPVVVAEVLSLLLAMGARLAGRGEFTQRAFLSGRIDLTQAEAVLDIIQAKTGRQSRRALSALSGTLGQRIKEARSQLVELLTRIVAGLDFPEEIGDAPEPEVEQVVSRNITLLEELARTARTGRYLRDGLKVAIVGRPNAGKSSLLNQLLKFERAIVTEVPGTTRDSLEEVLDLNGIPILLIDTAGIRSTEDTVEKIGIERSLKAIDQSDLVLLVMDIVEGWSQPEDIVAKALDGKSNIVVANKSDLSTQTEISEPQNCLGVAVISAKTGANLQGLTAMIEEFVFTDQTSREAPSLNARQAALCTKAVEALHLVLATLRNNYPQDCLATDLKTAVDALSEISGESVSEEVIAQVFATFCIGK